MAKDSIGHTLERTLLPIPVSHPPSSPPWGFLFILLGIISAYTTLIYSIMSPPIFPSDGILYIFTFCQLIIYFGDLSM